MEMTQHIKIALVDDDPMMLKLVQLLLEQRNDLHVKSYSTGEAFLSDLGLDKPDILVTDYWLNSTNEKAMSGGDLIKELRSKNIDLPIIVVSSQKEIEVALELIKLRVVDYIEKTNDYAVKIEASIQEVKSMMAINEAMKTKTESMMKDKNHLMILGIVLIIGLAGALLFSLFG